MKEGGQYGSYDWTNGNDGDVTGQPTPSAYSIQEESLESPQSTLPEFLTADRRLMNYHLFFSSKL